MTRRGLNTVAGALFVAIFLAAPWVLGVWQLVAWTIEGATR